MAKPIALERLILPAPRPAASGDIRVVNAGYLPAKQEWIHQPFPLFAVGMVVSGRGTYRTDDGPVQHVEPGCVFSVYPGPAFHYGPESGTTWEEYFLCIMGDGVTRWQHAGWLFTDAKVHRIVHSSQLVELYRELFRVIRRGEIGDGDRAVVIAERLLIEMFYSRASLRRERTANSSMQAVMEYCRQHYDGDVDFESLASANAMSYSSLRQQLRKLTGLSPARYLTQTRCEAARLLLSDTDLPIKQIASRVGIDDPYTFSRTFKRTVGISPEHYRQQNTPWARAVR